MHSITHIYYTELSMSYQYIPTLSSPRTYKISCRGLGVLPALELSHNAINYSATALGSSNTVSLKVSNPKLSRLSSAVIRGALMPQGPKMFEFSVPQDCPISVCPRVGEVPLGGVSIQCFYLCLHSLM